MPSDKSKALKRPWEVWNLSKTKLCTEMESCRFHRKGRCKFAHSLWDLERPPAGRDKTPCHLWAPGMPPPERAVVEVIGKHLRMERPIPNWVGCMMMSVHPNRAQEDVASSAKASEPSVKRARFEDEIASSSTSSRPPDALLPNWDSEYVTPEEGASRAHLHAGTPEEPILEQTPNAAAIARAIVGWKMELDEDEPWPGKGIDLSVGSLILKGCRVILALCGIEELKSQYASWMKYPTITVQCGTGSWAYSLDTLMSDKMRHDKLVQWSHDTDHGGEIPSPNATAADTENIYTKLTHNFHELWMRCVTVNNENMSKPLLLFFSAKLDGTAPMASK